MGLMRVNREQFLQALQAVSPGLASREIVEQSTSFVFKDGMIRSFNDELSCAIPSPLNGQFEGAIPAEKMVEDLSKWPDDEITVEPRDGELLFVGKGGKRKSGVRLDNQITLPISAVEKPTKWKKLHEDFGDAVNVVQQCAGKDESKFNLTCVHLTPTHIEACDNFQVCRWDMKTGVSQKTLVRQYSIKHITTLGMTEFSETDCWIHFKNNAGLVMSCRRYMEEFPDLSGLLSVEGEPAELPKGIIQAAEIAQTWSSENQDNNQLLIELKPGWVTVRGEGVSGWHEEPKKIKYNGQPITFMIPPQLLIDIVNRHSNCIVSNSRLMVNAGRYIFVSCLSEVEEKKKDKAKKPVKAVKKVEEESAPITPLTSKKKKGKKEEEE